MCIRTKKNIRHVIFFILKRIYNRVEHVIQQPAQFCDMRNSLTIHEEDKIQELLKCWMILSNEWVMRRAS